MKKYKKFLILCLVFVASLLVIHSVQAVTLNQTNISLSVGQTSVINAYNYYGSSLYVSNNSNSYVATPSINGSNVSIYANAVGNTNITICESNSMVSCTTVYVSVVGNNNYYNNNNNNYNNYGGYYGYTSSGILDLNISSISLPVGGSITVGASVSNPAGIYASENTNSRTVSVEYSTVAPSAYYSASSSSYNGVPGCVAGASYSVLTGAPCYGNNYNNGYYNNNYNNYNYTTATSAVSIVISGKAVGSGSVTLCQNGTNTCTVIPVSVY